MSKPSAATELRNLRRRVKDAEQTTHDASREREILRGYLTRSQQDTAEWKRRFDALLLRVPVTRIHETDSAAQLLVIAKEIAAINGEPCPICATWPHRHDCGLVATIAEAEGR